MFITGLQTCPWPQKPAPRVRCANTAPTTEQRFNTVSEANHSSSLTKIPTCLSNQPMKLQGLKLVGQFANFHGA